MKRILLLICAIFIIMPTALTVLHSTEPGFAAESPRAVNAVFIRQMMQQLIDFLDSADYAEQVSWDEHLVMVYRLAAGRDPDLSEVFVLKKLHEQIEFLVDDNGKVNSLSFTLYGSTMPAMRIH